MKEKGGIAWGDPAEMVTAEKQRRVRNAARAWLAARPELGALDIAFDVVTVWNGKLRRIPDAF